jgi:hypothetical protein
MSVIKMSDYDDYREYKRDYDKQYRIKNLEKIKEKNKLRHTKEYNEKQYQKRKKYQKEYYQKKRENKEWVEEQKNKCNQYKEKNKISCSQKVAEYKKTYNGKKSHKLSEWTKKNNLKMDKENLDEIFNRWWNSTHCEICEIKYKTERYRCMEHHHSSGSFRCICCSSCNNKIGVVDRNKDKVLLELHKYFINNNILF